MDPLKICFVSSEIVPFAKTGGLADVSGALGRYLDSRGHDIRLFMPFYSTIDFTDMEVHPVDFIQNVAIEFGSFTTAFSLLTTKLPGSDADVYFIHVDGLYNRSSIYTDDADEYLRFAVLIRATLESCQRMGWAPDFFHGNDWQCGLLPLYLKTLYNWDTLFQQSNTILTIHNIGYQGIFPSERIGELGLAAHQSMLPAEDSDRGIINYMKMGILYSDVITTVSETYAREIQTAEYGAGMEGLLQHRSDSLVGILNGVDYNEWSPEIDPHIPFNYTADDLSGKEKTKQKLLAEMGLPYDADVPVCGIVSRLTGQKGFELFEDILFEILSKYNMQFVILGSGEEKYARFFAQAQTHFPTKLSFYNGFSNELAHLIEAGSDMFAMPSRYEPCGLNQIYSLKYGTVPIVRKTGGLADTVELYNWESQEGTGFVFEYFNSDSLHWAINYAYETYQNKEAWSKIVQQGMAMNFSWEVQVEKYIELYEKLRK